MINKEPLYKIGQEIVEESTGRKGKIKSIVTHNFMRPDYYIVFDNSDDSEESDERFINERFIKPVEPNTPKYGIGSKWRRKFSGDCYILEDIESMRYNNRPFRLISEDRSSVCYRNGVDLLKDFEPCTENQWNDYDPNVEPEVGRWIEWSDDDTHDLPSRVVKLENKNKYSLYFPNSKNTCGAENTCGADWLWHEFEKWGQWRYCDAPHIDVVTQPEPVENEKENTLTAEQFLKFAEGIKGLHPNETTKSNVQNMHNAHYEALAPHKPWDVFEVWVKANEDLFKQHPTLSGYYSPVLKYLGRLTTKEGESPVKNLEKAIAHIQKMIEILENNHD